MLRGMYIALGEMLIAFGGMLIGFLQDGGLMVEVPLDPCGVGREYSCQLCKDEKIGMIL